jgi:hypothetical protein
MLGLSGIRPQSAGLTLRWAGGLPRVDLLVAQRRLIPRLAFDIGRGRRPWAHGSVMARGRPSQRESWSSEAISSAPAGSQWAPNKHPMGPLGVAPRGPQGSAAVTSRRRSRLAQQVARRLLTACSARCGG